MEIRFRAVVANALAGAAAFLALPGPEEPQDEGRAGHHGYAISLVSSEEKHWLSEIEKLIKLQIPQETVPGFDPDPDFHEAGSRAHRGRRPAAAGAEPPPPQA